MVKELSSWCCFPFSLLEEQSWPTVAVPVWGRGTAAAWSCGWSGVKARDTLRVVSKKRDWRSRGNEEVEGTRVQARFKSN